MAVALDQGAVQFGDIVDTTPGKIKVQGYTVQDYISHGPLSMSGVIQKSSNVGITKVLLKLPDPGVFPYKLRDFGFGGPSGLGYPGEQYGTVADLKSRQKFSLATMAFGYGIATTTLQLAEAYAVIANGGKTLPLTLEKNNPHQAEAGQVVISPKAAKDVITMMETVLQKGGTGWRMRLRNYPAAAKTGTARKAVKGGYAQNRYVAAFVGIMPAEHPRYVMAVMINDPRGGVYNGGPVAGPVYAKVMNQIMPQTLPPQK